MSPKEKMLEIIKNKKSGGKAEYNRTPKNDQKYMRKAPVIHKK
ncbi:hypothetical protein [Marinilactibacillus sp. Marseille-P9653]|nr:hypothetical protein [Marinilactibacillus sp. Marseille-P9653]